jgi:hypothetical protein
MKSTRAFRDEVDRVLRDEVDRALHDDGARALHDDVDRGERPPCACAITQDLARGAASTVE